MYVMQFAVPPPSLPLTSNYRDEPQNNGKASLSGPSSFAHLVPVARRGVLKERPQVKQKVSLRLLVGTRAQQPGRGPDYAELAQAALHAPDGRRPLPDAAVRGQGVPRHLQRSLLSFVFAVVDGGGRVFFAEQYRLRPPNLLLTYVSQKCRHAYLWWSKSGS